MFTCIFIFCNLMTQPGPIVPDGRGGYVPYTNSRVMPDGSLVPYNSYYQQYTVPQPYAYVVPQVYPVPYPVPVYQYTLVPGFWMGQ